MIHESDDSFPLDLERLLPASVGEILRHEDPQQFRQWLYQHLDSFIMPGEHDTMDAQGWRAFATLLGITIWNATPLPGHHFKPKPLPRAGRNDQCPCGSGQKFKRCCSGAQPFPPLPAQMMWTFVLDTLSRADLERALQDNQLPIAAIIMHAADLLENNHPARVVKVLAPLFAGDLNRRGAEDDAFALDLLLNAYTDLGHTQKKNNLLAHITRDAKRTPLRAAAWQRLSSLCMDVGDSPGAWEAFQQAQRDHPNTPGLAHLEILLLAGDGRTDEIPERAKMWIRRLRRQDFEDIEELTQWLHEVAEAPEDALAALSIRSSDGDGQLLQRWLIDVRGHPIRAYAIADTDTDAATQSSAGADEHLLSTLQAMGIPAAQIDKMLDTLLDANGSANFDDTDEFTDDTQEPDSLLLAVPSEVRDMEREWHEVFPCAKPFSTNDEPFDAIDPWDTEQEWTAFLDRHPQACDSVDILDDLATALLMHPMIGEHSFTEQMLMPILERAVSIVEMSLADVPTPRLAWIVAANRPMLRAYARLALWKLHAGHTARAVELCERLCTLNPQDNHGLRGILMEQYLRAGRDEDAAALAARFSDDMLAETQFGNVLALYRLKKIDAAYDALLDATEDLPEVLRYLLPKRIRRPKASDDPGVVFGGEEQAWLYRQAMRTEWELTPGALDWLKQSSRAPK